MGNQGIRQGKISPPPITIHFQVFARLQGACNVFPTWHLATLHLAAPKGTILGGVLFYPADFGAKHRPEGAHTVTERPWHRFYDAKQAQTYKNKGSPLQGQGRFLKMAGP